MEASRSRVSVPDLPVEGIDLLTQPGGSPRLALDRGRGRRTLAVDAGRVRLLVLAARLLLAQGFQVLGTLRSRGGQAAFGVAELFGEGRDLLALLGDGHFKPGPVLLYLRRGGLVALALPLCLVQNFCGYIALRCSPC